jgi:basic amino acid/polyamine antiporter, APA family
MGEDHRALRFLAHRNRAGLPVVAIWAQAALALAMLLTSSFRSILLYVEFVLSVPLMMTVFGVIWLRWREPGLARPFRVWGYPLTPLVFLGMEAWFVVALLQRQPRESVAGIVTLVSGALVYWLAAGWGRR